MRTHFYGFWGTKGTRREAPQLYPRRRCGLYRRCAAVMSAAVPRVMFCTLWVQSLGVPPVAAHFYRWGTRRGTVCSDLPLWQYPIKMCAHGAHSFVFHAPERRGSALAEPIAAQPPCRVRSLCRVIKIITSAGAKHLRRSSTRGILKNRPGPRRGGG